MGWRVNRFEGAFGFELDFDTHFPDWLGREFFSVQRKNVTDQPAIQLQKLRVGKSNPLFAVRLDWKDMDLEKVLSGILHQRRIFRSANDVFVHSARLIGPE